MPYSDADVEYSLPKLVSKNIYDQSELISFIKKKGISTSVYWIPVPLHPLYKKYKARIGYFYFPLYESPLAKHNFFLRVILPDRIHLDQLFQISELPFFSLYYF